MVITFRMITISTYTSSNVQGLSYGILWETNRFKRKTTVLRQYDENSVIEIFSFSETGQGLSIRRRVRRCDFFPDRNGFPGVSSPSYNHNVTLSIVYGQRVYIGRVFIFPSVRQNCWKNFQKTATVLKEIARYISFAKMYMRVTGQSLEILFYLFRCREHVCFSIVFLSHPGRISNFNRTPNSVLHILR